jgi:rhamnosyltransferase
MYVAARMVLAGWKIHYNAEAVVEHSHGYTFLQEFRRYFDIGAFHAREQWLPGHFGTPGGEGIRFVLSEWRYLGASRFYLYPSSIIRTAMKLFGFRLGLLESKLPLSLKRAMSMQKAYWK